jgi:hypothetical protein
MRRVVSRSILVVSFALALTTNAVARPLNDDQNPILQKIQIIVRTILPLIGVPCDGGGDIVPPLP